MSGYHGHKTMPDGSHVPLSGDEALSTLNGAKP